MVNSSLLSTEMQPSFICLFPSYYSNFAVLILISTAIITQLSHVFKIGLMILITCECVICNFNSTSYNFLFISVFNNSVIIIILILPKIKLNLFLGVHCYMNIFPLEESFRFEDPESINV